MLTAPNASPALPSLPDGTRVSVLGRPGTVMACPDAETVAVRLDGEVRVDHWHPSQVELITWLPCGCYADHEGSETCPDCSGRGTIQHAANGTHYECEECDGRGHYLCTYCQEPATAGNVAVAIDDEADGVQYRHEWRCEDCHDEIVEARKRNRRRDAGDCRGDALRDERKGAA
jgi:hypothetical protein